MTCEKCQSPMVTRQYHRITGRPTAHSDDVLISECTKRSCNERVEVGTVPA